MTISFPLVLFIFLVQLLGYTIKGLIGFGNPLIAAPLLSMRLDNVVITPGSLLVDTPINAYITWKSRHSFQWRSVVPLLAAVMLGVIPGTMLLRFSMPWIIKTLLGAVVVLLGLEMATRNLRPVSAKEPLPWVKYVVAFFSGVCAGLFGINLFIVAYLERTSKDYAEFRGSLCFLFLGENLFRLGVYALGGLLTRDVLILGGISMVSAAAAMGVSAFLSTRIPEKQLRAGAIVLFFLGGVSIIFKSLVFHT